MATNVCWQTHRWNSFQVLIEWHIVSLIWQEEHFIRNTVIKIGNEEIGGNKVAVMAGPCAVESRNSCLILPDS